MSRGAFESAVNRLSSIDKLLFAGMSAALFKVISAARDFIRNIPAIKVQKNSED